MPAPVRTHRPVWHADACMPCGGCTRRCPSAVFVEQRLEPDSLRARLWQEVSIPETGQPLEVPACVAACPLGQDIPGYLSAIARGEPDAALELIRKSNPLPAVCGRLCLAACMNACVRRELDQPVAIRALKRAAVVLASPAEVTAMPTIARSPQVVVIGAGPAGLAAAWALARAGLAVQIREAGPRAGGLLRTAVPEFDLPGEELQIDLDAILDLGVELICDQPLEHLSDLEALFDQGARAVVLATGAGKGRGLGIPGEQLAGSTDALGFAERQRINPEPIERPVVVAGGGSTAVAVARMAKKAGAPSVKLVFRRARQAIPARAASLRLAEDEGVELISECQVVHILGDRSVAGVRCAPIVFSAPDRVGRRWPVSEGEPFVLPAGWFIAAEDRLPDLAWTGQDERLRRSPLGTLQSGFDGLTGWPGVFAAGEVTLGARNVVAVMAHGIRVARAVADFVSRA